MRVVKQQACTAELRIRCSADDVALTLGLIPFVHDHEIGAIQRFVESKCVIVDIECWTSSG